MPGFQIQDAGRYNLRGKKPLSASIMVQKYLRPAAITAGLICADWEGRFGFHNFRHSLAMALVKLKVDPKTVQGVLRHEDFGDVGNKAVPAYKVPTHGANWWGVNEVV